MGANQSQQQQQRTGSGVISSDGVAGHQQQQRSGGILVVNPTPSLQASQEQIVLPARVPPVLTIEGNQIDPERHKPSRDQLRGQLWSEFACVLSDFAGSRSEFVVSREGLLREKIGLLEGHVQAFTDSYVNEKHRALTRMNDDSKRLEEIERQLEKCTLQAELCFSMLNKLNFLLPEAERLEPLD